MTLDLFFGTFGPGFWSLSHSKSFADGVFRRSRRDGRTICWVRLVGVGNHAARGTGSTYCTRAGTDPPASFVKGFYNYRTTATPKHSCTIRGSHISGPPHASTQVVTPVDTDPALVAQHGVTAARSRTLAGYKATAPPRRGPLSRMVSERLDIRRYEGRHPQSGSSALLHAPAILVAARLDLAQIHLKRCLIEASLCYDYFSTRKHLPDYRPVGRSG